VSGISEIPIKIFFSETICSIRTNFDEIVIGWFSSKILESVAQLEPNFDGIVIGWSSSKIVSGSRTLPPQCSCVVIESSFDPGKRLQAPGSLWFVIYKAGHEPTPYWW
jgi:hypothetical protein